MSNAFDRFTEVGPGHVYEKIEGEFLALLTRAGITWTWVVFRKGRVIGGRYDAELSAADAAQDAINCIDARHTMDEACGLEAIR